MNLSRPSRLLTIAALLLLLVACSAPAVPEEPVTPEATHTHEPEPVEPTETSAAQAPGNIVNIGSMSFGPRSLTVPAGTTVTWINSGGSPHTVTADDGSFRSPELPHGAEFSFAFNEPGSYDYYCEFHGAPGLLGMSATIIVEE